MTKQQKELQEVFVKDLSWIPLAGIKDAQMEKICSRNGIQLRFSGFDTHRLLELTAQGKCAMILPRCLVPREMTGISWLPLEGTDAWELSVCVARNARKNLLYDDALRDLYKYVFLMPNEKEVTP